MDNFVIRCVYVILIVSMIYLVFYSDNSEGFRHHYIRNHGPCYVTRDIYPLEWLPYPDAYRQYPDEA